MATPSTAHPNVHSRDRQIGRAIHPISGMSRDDAKALSTWTVAIGAALLAFWLSEGTSYHQLAVGILMSSATLLILMALFEVIWRLIDWRIFDDRRTGRSE